MAFGQELTERKSYSTEKLESPFLKLLTGQDVVIRVLDENITPFYRYWFPVNVGGGKMDGRPIIVAFDNPIKDLMNKLGADHPDFRRPARRAYVNVLDRTQYKPGEPENKVKILEVGTTLVQRLQVYDNRVINRADFHKMKLQELDILLVTVGSGKDKDVIPSPDADDTPLSPELQALPRYDLKKIAQPMPNEAIQRLIDKVEWNEVRNSLGWTGGYPLVETDIPF